MTLKLIAFSAGLLVSLAMIVIIFGAFLRKADSPRVLVLLIPITMSSGAVGGLTANLIREAPAYFERQHMARMVEETTPKWSWGTVALIKREKMLAKKTAHSWFCDTSRILGSTAAQDYIAHREYVRYHNNTVRRYQMAVMRNLHGSQYADLGIVESLPQTMRTCRGELI